MAAGRRSELARRRRALGLSQEALAEEMRVDARSVGRWERGEAEPQPWQRLGLAKSLNTTLEELDWYLRRDEPSRHDAEAVDGRPLQPASPPLGVLGAGEVRLHMSTSGDLLAQLDRRSVLIAARSTLAFLARHPEAGTLTPAQPAFTHSGTGFGDMIREYWPESAAVRPGRTGLDWELLLPSGRSMLGTSAAVRVRPARQTGGFAVLKPEDAREVGDHAGRAGRELLAASIEDESRFFLLDARAARRQHGGDDGLAVPLDFELDDLTFGIVWAVANLDDALTSEDRMLDEARNDLTAYEQLAASSVGRESAPDLNPIAQLYLGSEFCARYVLRSLPALAARPVAWTKEQRGEEASTWLLFDHKFRYLRETVAMAGGSMDRGFCVPPAEVRSSPRYERVLLFLAIALMESLGIHVHLTADAGYASVEGFVITPGRQNAIIADWVGGEGMWHVDLTRRPSSIRQFEDVAGDVATDSAKAHSPAHRLAALADYLELDRGWLIRRCAEIGRHGTDSLVQSRSRLISPAGLDAACRYVGSLQP